MRPTYYPAILLKEQTTFPFWSLTCASASVKWQAYPFLHILAMLISGRVTFADWNTDLKSIGCPLSFVALRLIEDWPGCLQMPPGKFA